VTGTGTRVIDIVFNLYTPEFVSSRGQSVGPAFMSKVKV